VDGQVPRSLQFSSQNQKCCVTNKSALGAILKL